MAVTAEQRITGLERDLAALLEGDPGLSTTPTAADVCETVLARTIEATAAEAGSVFLVEKRTARLVCAAAAGEKAAAVRKYSLMAGRGILGLVAESGRPILTTAEDPRHDHAAAARLEYPVDEILCVPILDPTPHPSEGGLETLGVIEILTRKGSGRRFSAADQELLLQIAVRAGKAIETARILELKSRRQRFEALAMVIRGVVHDVRNPLTFINGFAEALADESDPDRRAKARDSIFRSVQDINEMLLELAEFSRGDETTHRTKANIPELVEEVVRLFAPRAEGAKLGLRTRIRGNVRDWNVDAPKIHRALCNLVKNALEATPPGGQLTVGAVSAPGNLYLFVRDTGTGIPREIMSHLFEPFVTGGKKGGTGLGLSICRRFAEAHGGDVDCRTRAGRGSRFVLRIPA